MIKKELLVILLAVQMFMEEGLNQIFKLLDLVFQ